MRCLVFTSLFFCLALRSAASGSEKGDPHYFQALIKVSSTETDSVLKANGIQVNSVIGQIRSVSVPENMREKLRHLPGVISCETGYSGTGLKPMNNVERALTKVDWVQNGTQHSLPASYNGQGVVIGIVDVGFQLNNPNLYSADDCHYRVKRYWEQNNFTGSAPSGYSYGTEFTDTSQMQTLNDVDGTHGTHVVGIAAGSGLGTPGRMFKGVAPEADLVLVSIKYSNDTIGGSALGDYIVANATIIDAYKYIFDYAASVGKPAVINLSWGMHTGPHDGTSLFDQATEGLVGKGRILVGANGNDGENPMHFYHRFNQDTVGTIMIENNRQYRTRESIYSDFWGSANSSFSVKIKIIDTLQNKIVETPFISSHSDTSYTFNYYADTSHFKIVIDCKKSFSENNKPNITVSVDHQKQIKYAVLAYLCSDNSEVHGWNSGAVREWTSGSFRNKLNKLNFEDSFIDGNTDYTASENGGTSKAVISVGALAARSAYLNIKGKWINDSGYVIPPAAAAFSGKGPTTDGRIKPDVTAPGYDVPSSLNNKQIADWMLDRTLLTTVFRNDTQYWTAFNGTSMAAPHVTGIVALMLQAYPELDAQDAASILRNTADADQITGQVPNNRYGYGRVNAYSAVVATLAKSGINLPKKEDLSIYPNPVSNYFILPADKTFTSVSIINSEGKTVLFLTEGSFPTGRIDISGLSSGAYVVKLEQPEGCAWLKLVVN